MGKRGPPPTPKAVLERRGSWRAGLNPDSPEATRGRPPCPSWLNDRAKAFWRKLIPQLDEMGVLGLIDRGALARYCQLYDRWREAEETIRDKGSVVESYSESGELTIKPRPEVKIASDLASHLSRLEREFGLTPSARTSLRTTPKKEGEIVEGKGRFFEKKSSSGGA